MLIFLSSPCYCFFFYFALHFQFYFMSIEFNFNRNNVLSCHLPISMNHSLLRTWITCTIMNAIYWRSTLCYDIVVFFFSLFLWFPSIVWRIRLCGHHSSCCFTFFGHRSRSNYASKMISVVCLRVRVRVYGCILRKFSHTSVKCAQLKTAISNSTHMDTIPNWRLLLCMKFQSHLK